MKTLILKLGAAGDVVRTTSLLNRIDGDVTWVTAAANKALLPAQAGGGSTVHAVSWEELGQIEGQSFDLVINLEDDRETAEVLGKVTYERLFGASVTEEGEMTYSECSKGWFDMSLISRHGHDRADQLKLKNRRTYQDLLFEGLGFPFQGECYVLPDAEDTNLRGDVALAPVAGAVWPMKNWGGYDELKVRLEKEGLAVNVLPRRSTLIEHLGDIQNHRCLISGDSLPMHLALGSGIPCVTLFNCTSPWEICDYGIQTKMVSPLLEEFFYQRGENSRAGNAIEIDDVFNAALDRLGELNACQQGRP